MNTYKIFRWDGILAPNGLNKMPVIYVYPDIQFLENIKEKNVVLAELNGTDSVYDGKQVLGSVSRSSFSLDDDTNQKLYLIELKCIWFGYPPLLGNATLLG